MRRIREFLFGARQHDVVQGVRARVDKFRDLLERNNQALELMADAEEKLGGEYIFDSQYLRWLDAELAQAVGSVVQDLLEIAPGRYEALRGAFERIHDRLSAISETHALAPDGPRCVDLEEVGSEHASSLGEKMARLGELRSRVGAPVPPGFVVSAAAFSDLIHTSRLAPFIDAADAPGADLAAVAAELQACLEGTTLAKSSARAIKSHLKRFERNARFAVRSSALGEDGELSFAGVHTTVLNVPRGHVVAACRRVVASLFSQRALLYRRNHGQPLKGAAMAVGCIRMVPAVASGVLYTFDPGDPATDTMLISAAWGLGATVVEGTGSADHFRISRRAPHPILEASVVKKTTRLVSAPDAGLQREAVPAGLQTLPSIGDSELAKLASMALAIERHMHSPQDIEWALDGLGALWILQARPLRLGSIPTMRPDELSEALSSYPILMRGAGVVACRGIATGRVVVVTPTTSPDSTPPGSILVTQTSSPDLSRFLPSAAALIADSGSPTGHLAALAREHRVPALMATAVASQTLEPGAEVTVDAEENIVYSGRVEALVRHSLLRADTYEDSRDFRLLRGMLQLIAPLHLRDPESRRFTPQQCTSYHDIIRFAHEKAVTALSDLSDFSLREARRQLRPVALDIPLGLTLLDLGGGVAADAPPGDIELAHVTSKPLAVLLEALAAPGVWGTRPADMDLTALVSGATRSGALTEFGAMEVKRNLAIASARYVNLSLYLGYHFNVIDCYLGDGPEDSYMLFRFVGGLSDPTRRARRAELLDEILSRHGFAVERAGDLIIARLHNASPPMIERRLQMTGRLIGFTRQLDVLLRNDEITKRMVSEFMAGGCDPSTPERSDDSSGP